MFIQFSRFEQFTLKCAFSTEDILTCLSRKSTCVNNKIKHFTASVQGAGVVHAGSLSH